MRGLARHIAAMTARGLQTVGTEVSAVFPFGAIRNLVAGVALATIVLATSCQVAQHALVVDVDPNNWKSSAVFVLHNTDTTTLREMQFFIRCDKRLSGQTFSAQVTVSTPDTLRIEEPLLLHIPRRTAPASITQEIKIPYRKQIRFQHRGLYRVTITPSHPIQGVEAVGLIFTKSK